MLRDQQEEAKRLRHLREKYRDLADSRGEEIDELKEQLNKNIETFNPRTEYVDSDEEVRLKLIKRSTAPAVTPKASTRNTESRRNTSAGTVTSRAFNVKSNNKYPDVPDFKGTEGSSFYES